MGGEECLKGNNVSCLLKSKWRRQVNNSCTCWSPNISLVVVVVESTKLELSEGLSKLIHAVFKTVPGI